MQMNKLMVEWDKYAQKTWKMPYKTHCCLKPFTANCLPKDTLMHEKYYTFFCDKFRQSKFNFYFKMACIHIFDWVEINCILYKSIDQKIL